MRLVLLAACALSLSGCLYHEVRIDAAVPANISDHKKQHTSVGSQVSDHAPALTKRGPLPYDIPVTWIVSDNTGHMLVGQTRAMSPLPWWQRFPVDLFVDMWPGDVSVETIATVTPTPVRIRTVDEITAEAHANGYAP